MKKLIVLFCSVLFVGSVLVSNAQADEYEYRKGDIWEYVDQVHQYKCKAPHPRKGQITGTLHLRDGVVVLVDSKSRGQITLVSPKCSIVSTPVPEPEPPVVEE